MRKIDQPSAAASCSSKSLLVPKGVHFVPHPNRSKPSYWYVYAWRGGPQIARIVSETKPSLTTEQIDEINRRIALRDHNDRETLDPRDESTPLKWLIDKWRSDPEWTGRALGTQRTWGYELKSIEKKWGGLPLMLFYDERMVTEIYQWRDARKKSPRPADIGVTVLRQLLKFGRPLVGSTVDITEGIKPLYKPNARPEIIWTDEEIDRFILIAHREKKPELANVLRLAALTGLRRSSLISVKLAHVAGQALIKRARKAVRGRRRLIALPTFSSLARLLSELRHVQRKPGVKTILVNASGDTWDGDYLTHEFTRIRDLAKIKHIDQDTPNRKPKTIMKTLHDVRGTFATKLMTETDLDDTEVARVMGWDPRKVQNIRRAYVRDDAYMQALGARMRRQGA